MNLKKLTYLNVAIEMIIVKDVIRMYIFITLLFSEGKRNQQVSNED